jgi:hypothetical protein
MYLLAIFACIGIYLYATETAGTEQTAAGRAAPHHHPPTLHVTHSLSGNDLHLRLTVTDFTFSLDNMGKENKYGEGHVHLYLDGKKVAKIFERQFVLKDVSAGRHEVVVELAHNNHDSYGVKKTFEIEVKP